MCGGGCVLVETKLGKQLETSSKTKRGILAGCTRESYRDLLSWCICQDLKADFSFIAGDSTVQGDWPSINRPTTSNGILSET